MVASRAGTRVLATRFGSYRVTWIPLAYCALDGFRATALQATPRARPRKVVRLTLYERVDGDIDVAA